MKTHVRPATLLAAALVALPILSGCKAGYQSPDGGGTNPTPEPGTVTTYSGPGSSWELALDTNELTFTLDRRANLGDSETTLEIDGDYEVLSSGFWQLTVNSATFGQGVNVGDRLRAVNISDQLMLILPFLAGNDQILAMPTAGTCPSATTTRNWILYRQSRNFSEDNNYSGHFGSMLYSPTSKVAELSSRYALDDVDTNIGGTQMTAGDCTDGVMTAGTHRYYLNGDTAAIEVATSEDNLASGDTTDAQFLLSLEQLAFTASTDFDGTYFGILYDQIFAIDQRAFPVKAECTSGNCTVTQMTDVENGDLAADSYSLDLTGDINSPTAGYTVGELTSPADAIGTISCSINIDYVDSNKSVMACVGISPGSDNTGRLLNLFLISEE